MKWAAFVWTAALLGGCSQDAAICEVARAASAYSLRTGQGPETALEAFNRAALCIHTQAYRLAGADAEADVIVEGVLGACRSEVQYAQAQAYLENQSGDPLPPPGFYRDAPPCRDGKPTCKPWERAWTTPPTAGDVVTEDGGIASPAAAIATATAEAASSRVLADLRRVAAFRVVQARAGKCHR